MLASKQVGSSGELIQHAKRCAARPNLRIAQFCRPELERAEARESRNHYRLRQSLAAKPCSKVMGESDSTCWSPSSSAPS